MDFPEMEKNVNESVLKLIKDIRQGDIKRSYDIAVATIPVLKDIIKNSEWKTARDLMATIQYNERYLTEVLPLESCVRNIFKRVLHIIREQYVDLLGDMKLIDDEFKESLHKIITGQNDEEDFNILMPPLEPMVLFMIRDVQHELKTSVDAITKETLEHIHSNEIIMTIGKSTLVEESFKRAATTRSFEVIVAEGGPSLPGHEMAVNLAKAKIKTTLISDAAIFAMMPKVNKVIIDPQAVMANGSLRAISGSRIVAEAAKHYAVPVIVLLPSYKLSTLYYIYDEQDKFHKHISPLQGVIDSSNAALMEKTHAYNPVFDYVHADLITLYIADDGCLTWTDVFRRVRELYYSSDCEFEK